MRERLGWTVAGGTGRIAVLHADVIGLEREQGEGTSPPLERHRDALAKIIAEHDGELLRSTGQTPLIAIFPRAVDAVGAAFDLQQLGEANDDLPAAERLHFAIGIEHGQASVENGRASGPAADAAGALRRIARPGKVLVSKNVFRQIRPRLHFAYRSLGARRTLDLKNPVTAYQVKRLPEPSWHHDALLWLRRPGMTAVAGLLVAMALGGAWHAYERFAATPADRGHLAIVVPETGAPATAAPEAPAASVEALATIAVLPFAAGDGGELYFSDGVTGSLIAALGRTPGLAVIAAESSSRYGGENADPVTAGRELAAGYVVQGSAGRVNGELVLTAWLLDARTGEMLWEAPYEARSRMPVAAQSGLVQRLVGTLGESASLPAASRGSAGDGDTGNLEAFDSVLRARDLFHRFDREDNLRAREAARRAIDLDASYASAYAYVAWTFMADYWRGWSDEPQGSLEQAVDWADQAVRLDANDFEAHWAQGDVFQAQGRFDDALHAYRRALEINPNAAELLEDVGTWMLPVMGRPEEGLALAETAARLNPHHAEEYHGDLALNYYLLERYHEAIDAVNRMQEPRIDHLLYLGAAYAQLDRPAEAKLVSASALASQPELTVDDFLATIPLRREQDRERLRAGLQKAGLAPGPA